MAFIAPDVAPLTQARATLFGLPDQAKAGAEKIIPKNGEGYVALIYVGRTRVLARHLSILKRTAKRSCVDLGSH